MTRKIFILIFGYAGLVLINACEKCPDSIQQHYDFKSLSFFYPDGTTTIGQDSLMLEIREDNIEFLAQNSFSLISNAYADCYLSRAALGKKYPIINFTITSNADWDEAHPAGSSLNDIAIVPVMVSPSQPPIRLSQVLSGEVELQYYLEENGHALKMPPPLTNKMHQFTISIEKENGETVQAITEEIRWE